MGPKTLKITGKKVCEYAKGTVQAIKVNPAQPQLVIQYSKVMKVIGHIDRHANPIKIL